MKQHCLAACTKYILSCLKISKFVFMDSRLNFLVVIVFPLGCYLCKDTDETVVMTYLGFKLFSGYQLSWILGVNVNHDF